MWWKTRMFVPRCVGSLFVLLLIFGTPYSPVPVSEAQQVDNQLLKKLIEDGINSYQRGNYEDTITKLTQAHSLMPTHSAVVLYLGLAYLRQDNLKEAIALWQEYPKLKPYTPQEAQANLPQVIPQYLTLLTREENQRLAHEAVANEQRLGAGDSRTVAIMPYRNQGSAELSPLAKGLTALLISDLAQVKDLKVVERERLQALLDEIQLGTSGIVKDNAPRTGRLLGAGKVATGSFYDPTQGALEVHSVLAETATASALGEQQLTGTTAQFYELEKALVLALLRGLGYDEQRLRAANVWDRVNTPQTRSLAAFTAFSNGLDAKDRGDYATARAQFEQALREDPNFELARKELLALPLLFLSSGGVVTAVASSLPPITTATAGLVTTATAGLSTTALVVGSVAAIGGGVGAGIAASGGGSGGPKCGNGKVEGAEQCDPGPDVSTDCCTADCKFTAAATVCRAATGECSQAATCTGTSATCPANGFAAAGTVCRPPAGPCDIVETCTGNSASCPADGFVAANTVCRASAGVCDVAETCTGTSALCPTDGFAPASQTCRAAAGVCDVAETCTGNSAACPTDGFAPASQTCRPAAGICDVAETCTGNSAACPTDSFAPASQTCRAAAGVCDVAENCTGNSTVCPADQFRASGALCNQTPTPGDQECGNICDGSAAACSANFVPSGASCNGGSGSCDGSGLCSG